MSGITIVDVKVVGLCSKHKRDGFETPLNKDGSLVPDKDIACVECALLSEAVGDENKS